METNFSNWNVDLPKRFALHETGAIIRFSGDPDSNNFEGTLYLFPENLSAIEKVRLVRHGFEAYRKAYAVQRSQSRPVSRTSLEMG
jgi:hypothetical protein